MWFICILKPICRGKESHASLSLSAAQWLFASQTTTFATLSATLAQIAVLTSRWEATSGWEMLCTVRSMPKRGTKAWHHPLEPLYPLATKAAVPHPPFHGRRVLVWVQLHLTWFTYRLWDLAGGEHWSTAWHRMFFFQSHLTIFCNIKIHFFAFPYTCMRTGVFPTALPPQ